jgi:hypothetical protein
MQLFSSGYADVCKAGEQQLVQQTSHAPAV